MRIRQRINPGGTPVTEDGAHRPMGRVLQAVQERGWSLEEAEVKSLASLSCDND